MESTWKNYFPSVCYLPARAGACLSKFLVVNPSSCQSLFHIWHCKDFPWGFFPLQNHSVTIWHLSVPDDTWKNFMTSEKGRPLTVLDVNLSSECKVSMAVAIQTCMTPKWKELEFSLLFFKWVMIKGHHLSDKKTHAKMVKSWINKNSHMKPI